MFEVTPDDIARLNDSELRELVALLCEAELQTRGQSTVHVTWGGKQQAPDGGLDVRVNLPINTATDGYIPRSKTGFQVKQTDMPRAAIQKEMRPQGQLRPVIEELARNAGAYVIVSSQGSVTDNSLNNRLAAMREALKGSKSASDLHVDFYDRRRLTSWVSTYPGVNLWVRTKVGRALEGWQPVASWSHSAEGIEAEYIPDPEVTLKFSTRDNHDPESFIEAVDRLRRMLAEPQKSVRLVGMSGVGKTRLAQALFDPRIGLCALDRSLAVYTDTQHSPNPQPLSLASDLITNGKRAILVIDNCSADLHRDLADRCKKAESKLTVLTIEYDVQDGQQEGTDVVRLESSSPATVETLLKRRHPGLSDAEVHRITEFSGGNFRIGLALAAAANVGRSIAGLSDDELFRRLFRQRQDSSETLLRAAEALSLVYSFNGADPDTAESELTCLAALADQSPNELFSNVAELLRRELAQKRGEWRAVLPQAIANRLATRALQNIIPREIEDRLQSTERLSRSFSKRLGYLQDSNIARDIVKRWLAPDGRLADVSALDAVGEDMLHNIAPVAPELVLAALERIENPNGESSVGVWRRHKNLLLQLAYDPTLFERSVTLIANAVIDCGGNGDTQELKQAFTSLFTIQLSGTHATIEQRLMVIERLLRSQLRQNQQLGLSALEAALKTTDFVYRSSSDFGALPRDYGYRPLEWSEGNSWYCAVLDLIERLILVEEILIEELRELLARSFRELWPRARVIERLESIARKLTAQRFWGSGWVAARRAVQLDQERMRPEDYAKLCSLEDDLKPLNLVDSVRGLVLGSRYDHHKDEKLDQLVFEYGKTVVEDLVLLEQLAPELIAGGHGTFQFGRGLAIGSVKPNEAWSILVESLQLLPAHQRYDGVLVGFVTGLRECSPELADELMDKALEHPELQPFVPGFCATDFITPRDVARLKKAAAARSVPARTFERLAGGSILRSIQAHDLKELALSVAELLDGYGPALTLLSQRFVLDRNVDAPHEHELVEAGRQLISSPEFANSSDSLDYYLGEIVTVCAATPEASSLAADCAVRIRKASFRRGPSAYSNRLTALLMRQPLSVLDALFAGSDKYRQTALALFQNMGGRRTNPADAIPTSDLMNWCRHDPEERFLLAARIVTFARQTDGNDGPEWTEVAKQLIASSTDPCEVIKVFVERFEPRSWSGSEAAVVESNARLLDDAELTGNATLKSCLQEARSTLAETINRMRANELNRDRDWHERFE